MNVTQLKKIIKEKYPEINLQDFGMDGLSKEISRIVLLKDILEEKVEGKYYLKNSIIEDILKTKEFGKRFSCLKTEKFSN